MKMLLEKKNTNAEGKDLQQEYPIMWLVNS